MPELSSIKFDSFNNTVDYFYRHQPKPISKQVKKALNIFNAQKKSAIELKSKEIELRQKGEYILSNQELFSKIIDELNGIGINSLKTNSKIKLSLSDGTKKEVIILSINKKEKKVDLDISDL